MLNSKTYVVVVNGFHALALHNTGSATLPHLTTVWEISDVAGHTIRPRQSRPGRVYQSMSTRRSAYEMKRTISEQKQHFLHRVVERLLEFCEQQGCESIILVASPGALGILRSLMPAHITQKIRVQIPKDYAKIRGRALDAALLQAIP